MEIAENIVLVAAVFWVVWQVITLRDLALNGVRIVTPIITSLNIFVLAIALLITLPISSLNLIWLFVLSLVLGFVAIIPLGQKIALGFLAIFAMTKTFKGKNNE